MITRGEDVEASALRQRGWSVSAIARHLGRDRKTVRAYLNGDRGAGVRHLAAPDRLGPLTCRHDSLTTPTLMWPYCTRPVFRTRMGLVPCLLGPGQRDAEQGEDYPLDLGKPVEDQAIGGVGDG